MEKSGTIDEIFSFFAVIHDPRREHPTTLHTLETILVMTILSVICGAQNWVEVEEWGESKKDWLSSFLDLEHGIPSHDTFARVFRILDASHLNEAFTGWMTSLADLNGDVVALDGKTIRRSIDSADGKGPIHLVSAWSSKNQMVLTQLKVDEKTNEIKAIPELLDILNLKGSIVTMDAMGCQTKIAESILEKKADYVLSLKENQPALYKDAVELFDWILLERPQDQEVEFALDENVDGGYGRVETRKLYCTEEIEGLVSCKRWKGLQSLVMVESTREVNGKKSVEKRYYISSLRGKTTEDANQLNKTIRTHWEIENKVHWVLDVAFREDENRARKDNSAENLALIRKLALNLIRCEKSVKVGVAAKQKKAGWNHDYLLKILSQS